MKITIIKEGINLMKQTKRLKLSRWQLIEHYFFLLVFLVAPAFSLYSFYEIYITGSYDGVLTEAEIISTTWPWLALAIAFYFIRKRRLNFRVVVVKYTEEEFQEAIRRTVKAFDWQIELNNNHIFRAFRPWNWTSSYGEMITIIKDQDRLLLNSICNPNKKNTIFSFGWNKRNVETFLLHLNDVKKGIPNNKKTN